MDTKILEYMVAIVEEKSVTRAAERFLLSHQALYRHVKNIESELGTPVFRRTPKGLQLTPAGIIFINDAQAILHMERELEASLAAMRRQKNKSLRIVVDNHLYNRFLKRIVPRFQKDYPDHVLEISTGNAQEARRLLKEGMADLAIFDSTSPHDPELEYLAFASMKLLPAFPSNFSGTLDASGLKEAIDGGMFIILFPAGTTSRSIEESQLASHRIYPTRILEGGIQNSISYISEGETCGLLPEVFCSEELRHRIRIGAPLFTVYNVIAYPRSFVPTGAAQAIMQIIMNELTR